jgi:hypothetical protein
MQTPRPTPTGSRVFITGVRHFEIVYLPETGQIVSRLEALAAPAGGKEVVTKSNEPRREARD